MLRLGIGLGVIPAAARPASSGPPVNVVAPSITGILTDGQTGAIDPGSWAGMPGASYAYQWQRNGTNIAGATAATRLFNAADVAAGAGAITCEVTATNDNGSTTAESAPVTIAASLALGGIPPAAVVGTPYSHTFTFTGGHAPRVTELVGTLIPGLTYDGTTHTISGTPISSGSAEDLVVNGLDADELTATFGPFDIVASAATPTSVISALVIQSSSGIDPSAVADAGNGVGIEGNGWVAKATVPYLAATTFDPTKIVLTVTDPGYDGTGTTVVTRTITGRAILRRQYPNQASLQATQVSTNLEVYFSLSDDIYAGSTVTDAQAEAGFYGASQHGEIASVTNSSTLAYEKPLFAWLNTQHERATGSTFPVEAVAYHRRARNGRQVARIEFIAKDAQGTPNVAATQTVSATALSSIQTKGQIVEAWKASIPLTALTQGDLCQVNAKVYPWIGDSSAVLDLEAAGVAWPTASPQTRLRFLNDKTGAYGGAIAFVRAGASGGTVSLTEAMARAAPFPTINGALTAIRTFNNANRGHNDHSGGVIYLMDNGSGGAVAHQLTNGMSGVTAGQCWTEIRPDPSAVGAVSFTLGGYFDTAGLLKWVVNTTQATGGFFDGGPSNGNVMQAWENQTITISGASVPINYQCGLTYCRNVTINGVATRDNTLLAGYSTTRTQTALALGHMIPAATPTTAVFPFVMIGSRLDGVLVGETDLANVDAQDGRVIANNRIDDLRDACVFGHTVTLTKGIAIVQNVFERASVASSPCLQIAADGAVQAVANVVEQYNTVVGERTNRAYSDVAGAMNVKKKITSRFNLWHQYNIKSDTYVTDTTVSGRVGNWRARYTVGFEGNISLTGSAQGTTPAANGSSWLGEAWPDTGSNVTAAAVTFTDNKSGSANPGGGTYSLTGGSNAAYGRVPAGSAGLAFDLAGVARLNNGNGAAGAYERTV